MQEKSKNAKRTKIIPIRVTPQLYAELEDFAAGYDMPVSTLCYLSVVQQMRNNLELCNPNLLKQADDLLGYGVKG